MLRSTYIHERDADRRGGLEQAKRDCMDRERWKLFCRGHLLGGHFLEEMRCQ